MIRTSAEVVCRILIKVQSLLEIARRVHLLRARAIWSWRVALMACLDSLALVGMRTP